MHENSIPSNDDERLAELRRHAVLDTPPEQSYDDVVQMLSRMLDMPIAGVSFVDEQRVWLKAGIGLETVTRERDDSWCSVAILQEGILAIPDTRQVESKAGAIGAGVPGKDSIGCYYGVPLRSGGGHALGVLFVADHHPRSLDASQCELLEVMGRQVATCLELRRVALAAREAEQKLAAAHHAQGEFLASMSHELRTPLSAIIGFTSILRQNKPGNLNVRDLDYMGRIRTNGEHLLRLVNDILDLSKVESDRIEVDAQPLQLDELLHTMLAELEGRRGEIPILFEPPQNLQPIVADPHRFRQVVLNLIVNALKFTEEGGIELRVVADPDGVPLRLDVVDSGIGIPPEELSKIFDRFGQAAATQGRQGSWGLGLFLSRKLCGLMGFDLVVASEVEMGTAFSIVLSERAPTLVYSPPRLPGDAEPWEERVEADDGELPSRVARAGKTVLVVDDDADARAVLESYIQDFGCRVIALDSGERAIEIARQIKPDLITLDLLMPGLDGWSVLKALSEDEQLRDIPVAICSMADVNHDSSLQGVTAVLSKPVERSRFHGLLKDHLSDHLSRSRADTVLIVEPDAERGRSMARWVSLAGGIPQVFDDGQEALSALKEAPPSLALVSYSSQTHTMLERLREAVSGPSLPLVLYDFPSGQEPRLEEGVSILVREPDRLDIKAMLSECLGTVG